MRAALFARGSLASALLGLLGLPAWIALAHAAALPPRVVEVEPVRAGELLACRVATSGLPGDALASSMRSGLPSAIEMALDVLDSRDRVVIGNRVTFRLAFDLWEETFRVEGPGEERDFATREELDRYLAAMPRLPVAPLARLDAAGRFRLRVGVLLHPLAPEESARLGNLISGDAEIDRVAGTDPVASEDGREVLVSLGRVIRFFFDEARDRDALVAEGTSSWFTRAAIASSANGASPVPREEMP